jgi:hypothetical protein
MRGVAAEICFETTNPDLARFCERKLGFVQKDEALKKAVATVQAEAKGRD